MQIIFAGTPAFSVETLDALNKSEHEIIAVYCQPDRPKGRGKVMSACPVKIYAQDHNLPVFQPQNFHDSETQAELASLNADAMVVVAYGQILPKAALETPKFGCLNIHASLLPRWRGAAPIQRAILAGDVETGVGIMQMNEGLDTGDILLEKKCTIADNDTAESLHNKLAIIGAESILEALNNLDDLTAVPQEKSGITYAHKLSKQGAWIDWRQSAVEINRMIRAFNPYPIAQCPAKSLQFEDKTLRILEAEVVDSPHNKRPGEIMNLEKGLCEVATGQGSLLLKKVQLSGKKVAKIKDFNNAYSLQKLS
ncbi:MAG: methionyl-tRNA formyltransferase [Gammaproteobacteria bacterium]|nr:methionyl-tRNA formyltransferase [Gammaproteobacteria bacterium]